MKHVAARALERYGLTLAERDVHAIRMAIIAGASLLLARLPDGTERRRVGCQGVQITVMWWPPTQTLFTVVPPRINLPKLKLPKHQTRGRMDRRRGREGRDDGD